MSYQTVNPNQKQKNRNYEMKSKKRAGEKGGIGRWREKQKKIESGRG